MIRASKNFLIALCFLVVPSISFAQQQTIGDVIPENGGGGSGGNSLTGSLEDTIPLVSIGSGPGALSHGISIIGDDQVTSTSMSQITISDTANNGTYSYNVILPGNARFRFLASVNSPTSSTSFSEYIVRGNSLTFSNGTYTFTSRSGMVATFDEYDAEHANAKTITSADGTTLTYDYIGDDLSSIRSNVGYQLKFQLSGATGEVRALNNRFEYCNPTSQSCSVGSSWAKGTGGTSSTSFVDAENRTYSLAKIAFGGNSTQTLTYPGGTAISRGTYNSSGNLTQTNRFGVNKGYIISTTNKGTPNDDSDDERTVNVSLPGGGSMQTVSRIKGNLILSRNDTLSQSTTYMYNSNNQVEKVTYPRGDSVEYLYDSRGNVTQVKRISAQVSGSAPNLITSAHYPSSCNSSNFKYCNKPDWTRDTNGNQTDYTYHAQSGGVATMTAPSDGANGRAITKFTYLQYRAKIKNSSGSLINSTPIWKIQSVKQFFGTTSEVTGTYNYNVNKNLTPSIMSVSGNGVATLSTSLTYDNYGNQTQIDGPIPGTNDLSATFYDKLRRPYGHIGGDADGGGLVARQASRVNYKPLGVVESTIQGTTNGYDLSSLNSMATYQIIAKDYDGNGRLTKSTLEAGTAIYARQDYSYDTSGRIECSALRMNPATFGSSSTDACSLGSTGPFGADRITKRTYDVASRVTETISGFGTTAQSSESATYYNYGPVKYLYDGEGNQTYYRYDGFNRPWITYYPKASDGSYNASDYMRHYYDNYGRKYKVRQRDGELVASGFDGVNRISSVNAPGSTEDLSLTYDIAGRTKSISKTGQSITYTYDGFGRKKSESTPQGAIGYDYDNYGRLDRMDYPGSDNFYVTYEYLAAGGISAIREKGSTLLASYSYDARGRRSSVTRGSAANTTNYTYDAISRLTSLQNNIAGTSMDQTLDFDYTPSGQINTQVNSNPVYDPTLTTYDQDFVINGLNQIMSENGINFSYDTAGNLTQANGKTYGYDFANRLTSLTATTGNASLTYDAASRLSTVTKGSTSSEFIYDGANMIAEYNASTNALEARYVHGPGVDAPIVLYEHTSLTNFTRSWYVTDQKGSITGLTTSSGTSVATNTYSHYGQPGDSNVGRYGYTGQVWIEELDLYYYKARFYDPVIKRFLNTDPIGYGDGMNMYAYVGGDPVNMSDPSGMTTCDVGDPNCTDEIEVEGPRTVSDNDECPSGWVCYSGDALRDLFGNSYGFFGNDIIDFRCNGIECVSTYNRETNESKEGHDYQTSNVVCADASSISQGQLEATFAVTTIPQSRGRLIDTRDLAGGERVGVRTPGRINIRGGTVTTRSVGNLAARNTTAGIHVFQGTATRGFFVVDNRVYAFTRGVGNSPWLGMDSLNQSTGAGIFDEMDQIAQEILTAFSPGCS